MKCVFFQLPDNSVGVVSPNYDITFPMLPNETEDQYLDRIATHAIACDATRPTPDLTGAIRMPNQALPSVSMQRWRRAWRWLNGMLTVNLAAARLIRKAELLSLRDTRLERIRKKRQEADEDGKTAIATALKQRAVTLRGLDNTIDTQLATVSDLTTLDSWIPSEFSGTPD